METERDKLLKQMAKMLELVIHHAFNPQETAKVNTLLNQCEQLTTQPMQPIDVADYFKDKREKDEFGYTGMYIVSAKDILDFIIDKL